ncbi:MAG TPA: hypothetical protein VHX64_00425 [Caulobacteraceae bacterium]|nr:hypothetical protein [Caulobacteraceae bacterium]
MSRSDPVPPKKFSQAVALRREPGAFRQTWPGPPRPETSTPTFTWEQLERQLADLSGAPARAAITPTLVSALRKQARFKPPEMVLREILCLAWTLMDESFQPGLLPGEDAEMP